MFKKRCWTCRNRKLNIFRRNVEDVELYGGTFGVPPFQTGPESLTSSTSWTFLGNIEFGMVLVYDLPGFGLWSTTSSLWSTRFWLVIYFFFCKHTAFCRKKRFFIFFGAGNVLAYDLPILGLWSTYTLRSAEFQYLFMIYLVAVYDLPFIFRISSLYVLIYIFIIFCSVRLLLFYLFSSCY